MPLSSTQRNTPTLRAQRREMISLHLLVWEALRGGVCKDIVSQWSDCRLFGCASSTLTSLLHRTLTPPSKVTVRLFSLQIITSHPFTTHSGDNSLFHFANPPHTPSPPRTFASPLESRHRNTATTDPTVHNERRSTTGKSRQVSEHADRNTSDTRD